MKFMSVLGRRKAKIKKYGAWTSRFAFLPQRVSADTVVWLERYALRVSPGADPTESMVRVILGRHEYILSQPAVKIDYGSIEVGAKGDVFWSYVRPWGWL